MAKILLVEDDKSLREIYGVRLLAEGYDIVSAGDGEEALAMAIKDRPNLIVSDVMMPKISGFDMLDILRSTTETKDIKVIMMTALSSEDQRQRGQQLGADRYLVKSQVGIEDVVRTVHEVLGDAPVTPSANAFAPAAPSAVPRPAPSGVPPRPDASPTMPSPAPVGPQPSSGSSMSGPQPMSPPPAPQATPATPAPVSEPQATQTPAPTPAPTTPPVTQQPTPAPEPQAAPAPTGLPQPTAPFSTPRPAGLADRIIQPIEKSDDSSQPLAELMEKELGNTSPEPPSAPNPGVPPLASVPPREDSSITFEETPRNDQAAS